MRQVLQHLEHLARLTRGKDRDSLDVTLVEVLRSLLDARSVALREVLVEDGVDRLLTRGQLEDGMTAPAAPPPPDALSALPRLDADPEAAEALRARHTRVHAGPGGHRILVPVLTESGRRLLIDAVRDHEPEEYQLRVVEGMARIFENVVNLLDASERDTLTGLLNRKSFDDTFYKVTRGAPLASEGRGQRRADDGTYWLAVVDVDHFKQVNDRYGHLIGDEVLLLMARLLRSSFRHDDRVYRFGGEEFVALVRAGDPAAAAAAFERLRRTVEAHPFPQVGRVTVSIGFTRLRPHDTPADAFERADRAVYLAKAQGRNTVRCFDTDIGADAAPAPRESQGDVELF